MLLRTGLKRPFVADRRFVRYASAIISNTDRSSSVFQNDCTSGRLHVVPPSYVPVRHRRFDSKNDPKDDDGPEEVEESHSVRAVYDVKANQDNTSIATIQVPEELPFLPLVTIAKPPLYPRLFRIVEVVTCKYVQRNHDDLFIRLFFIV